MTNLSPQKLEEAYKDCLGRLGIAPKEEGMEVPNHSCYVTPRIMFMVVRSQPSINNPEDESATIDVNTIGFTGNFIVKNQ